MARASGGAKKYAYSLSWGGGGARREEIQKKIYSI